MSILGVGTDIIKVNRVRLIMARRGPLAFAQKILTPTEMKEFMSLRAPNYVNDWREDRRYIWLAGRFSAKESLFKAASPGLALTWQDVSIVKHRKGKPRVVIENPDIVNRLGKIHLSISHDGDYLTTMTVIEKGEDPPNTRIEENVPREASTQTDGLVEEVVKIGPEEQSGASTR
ncbi:4'-phosphopantetheinyl transferase [Calocera cornea HHB12733]|uniref:4'-phosphopantetheinyl transferase n=1 Tax=Calocera cornea HHB12733 TaxID=1353952 RepID=A0A165JWA9_9BASI|nr:4'-phosphopantetheinyl transferase [Calocera cornea HHB12733]